jgi:hypothetical protein
MKKHYQRLLEKELKRLWINETAVLIISEGKDKFTVSDGKRFFSAKGHLIYKHIRRLPNRAGYEKFWYALKPLTHKGKQPQKKRILVAA